MEQTQPKEKLVEIIRSSDGSFVQILDKRPSPTTQEEYLARSIEYSTMLEASAQQGI